MQIEKRKHATLLIFVLFIQIFLSISLVLNIPIIKQILGFVYITFVPGLILLKLFKSDTLPLIETVLFSVGLSIASMVVIGLVANELFPLIGISEPLSPGPLIVVLHITTFLLCLLACLLNRGHLEIAIPVRSKLFRIVPFVFIPILSIAGAMLVNVLGINLPLLFLIIVIAAIILVSTLSIKIVPTGFYPWVLLIIAIALLFHASLISNYVYGWDIHQEYHLFELTNNSSRWDSTSAYAPEYSKMNGMLSITVLPTLYSQILDISPTLVLKVIFPLIFSFVPVGIYVLYKSHFGNKVALVSSFFFMSHAIFFTEMLGLGRQMIAELFYVLIFIVLLDKRMSPTLRTVYFVMFAAALVVSHYSISYVFMLVIFFSWLFSFLTRIKNRIPLSFVLLFLTMSFVWYIYVSASGPYKGFMGMADHMVSNLSTDFFNLASRGKAVLQGLGVESAFETTSLGHTVGRYFFYFTEFFIMIGFVLLIVKQKMMFFRKKYFVFVLLNVALLATSIIVPNFARYLRMTRFYHILLFILAPLFTLGGIAFFKFVSRSRLKTKASILALVLLVLLPFFLFQTDFIYEVTGDSSWSVPLSNYRMGFNLYRQGFYGSSEVSSAQWLNRYNTSVSPVYSDDLARYTVLTSYGGWITERINVLSNTTKIADDGTVYLTGANTLYGTVLGEGGTYWNITEIPLDNLNKIYSNGLSEIYRAP